MAGNIQVKVVALDCDGVMLDSLKANKMYYGLILEHLGLGPVVEEDVPVIHTLPAKGAIAHLLRDRADLIEEAERFRLSMDYRQFVPFLKKEPGLKRFLEFAAGRFSTAVATNRADSMNKVLAMLEIENLIDLVVTARDVAHPKPAPDMLWRIVEHFSIEPGELLYVGDSEVDLAPAQQMGALFCAFKNPALKCDLHVGSFLELKELLGGSI